MKKLYSQFGKIFEKYPAVKLVYLFGSRARGDAGKLSDWDFAFYFDEIDKKKRFDLKLELFAEMSRVLQTDLVDVLILNDAQSPELKYHVIKEGHLLYEKEPFKVLLEPKILNEYFDFRDSLLRNHLTSSLL